MLLRFGRFNNASCHLICHHPDTKGGQYYWSTIKSVFYHDLPMSFKSLQFLIQNVLFSHHFLFDFRTTGLNCRDWNGETPLHLATLNNHL